MPIHHDGHELSRIVEGSKPAAKHFKAGTFAYDAPGGGRKVCHDAWVEEVIERNRVNGENVVRLRQAAIVEIYALWEDHYRPRLERLAGTGKNSILSPLFGDIRHYRRAVVHNGGVLAEATEILQFVAKGSRVELSGQHFATLLEAIAEELMVVGRRYVALDLHFRVGVPIVEKHNQARSLGARGRRSA